MSVALSSFLGTDILSQLHGGYQSLVYEAVSDGGDLCVAKLRDTQGARSETLAARMLMVADLAVVDPRICAPLVKNGAYVLEVDVDGRTMLGTLFEFAEGDVPDLARSTDVQLMGAELSKLHASLGALPRYEFPLVPALATVGYEAGDALVQLIHGDFSNQNVRKTGGIIRIFDFDDCGYGTREFDVANSLYMVLFDSVVNDRISVYLDFKAAFVDGYMADSAETSFDLDAIATFIDLRVNALHAWLSDSRSAPTGIRTATPQWRATLYQFVEHYRSQARP